MKFMLKVMLLWKITAGHKRILHLLFSCWAAFMCLPAHAVVIGGIDFPRTLGAFELGPIENYEKSRPGAGVSLTYDTPGVIADVYVYGATWGNIPDGVDSPIIKKHFASVKNDVIKMHPDAQILDHESQFLVEGIPVLHSAFQYISMVGGRKAEESHLYLTALKGNFVKVRITYSGSDHPELSLRLQTQFIESLCREMSKAVSIVSHKGTGNQDYIKVIASYAYNLWTCERCGKYPSLKKESEETKKKYMSENNPVLLQLNMHILKLALKRGGKEEVRRVVAEVGAYAQLAKKTMAEEPDTSSEQSCSKSLLLLRQGRFDLKVMEEKAIGAIMVSSE